MHAYVPRAHHHDLKSSEDTGFMPFSSIIGVNEAPEKRKYAFSLSTTLKRGKVHYLAAASEEEMHSWISAILAQLNKNVLPSLSRSLYIPYVSLLVTFFMYPATVFPSHSTSTPLSFTLSRDRGVFFLFMSC